MLMFLTSIALDLSISIAWWLTKKITYHTTSYIYSSVTPLMLTK